MWLLLCWGKLLIYIFQIFILNRFNIIIKSLEIPENDPITFLVLSYSATKSHKIPSFGHLALHKSQNLLEFSQPPTKLRDIARHTQSSRGDISRTGILDPGRPPSISTMRHHLTAWYASNFHFPARILRGSRHTFRETPTEYTQGTITAKDVHLTVSQ